MQLMKCEHGDDGLIKVCRPGIQLLNSNKPGFEKMNSRSEPKDVFKTCMGR